MRLLRMPRLCRLSFAAVLTASATATLTAATSSGAYAQRCSNTAAGFEDFKARFARTAGQNGIGNRGLRALASARYSHTVIKFDRRQARYFKRAGRPTGNFERFYAKKTSGLGPRARRRLARNRRLFDSLEKRYGVQREILVTIWGLETNFGGYTGKLDAINSLATLSHDCRRGQFFRTHLLAALKIIDRGWIARANMKGAGHGEIGQTQFMAANYLKYAVDGNGDGRRDLVKSAADALASTANFLRRNGWRPMADYQPGSNNFAVLNAWNESTAYQRTIARFAATLQ